ncbi:MAG: hypothetical protein J5978_09040 [Spirochaetaceae bacterium]|nr:hypothetical protein [Spirochaetaceae bacterium]
MVNENKRAYLYLISGARSWFPLGDVISFMAYRRMISFIGRTVSSGMFICFSFYDAFLFAGSKSNREVIFYGRKTKEKRKAGCSKRTCHLSEHAAAGDFETADTGGQETVFYLG